MSANIVIEDADGQQEAEIADPKGFFCKLLLRKWKEIQSTKTLQFVDPYGNTIFNQGQIPVFIQECKTLCDLAETEEVRIIDAIIHLAEQAIDRPHMYIKIYGD